VLWLDRGVLMFDGDPGEAVAAYTRFSLGESVPESERL
jgi:hypothetical protein